MHPDALSGLDSAWFKRPDRGFVSLVGLEATVATDSKVDTGGSTGAGPTRANSAGEGALALSFESPANDTAANAVASSDATRASSWGQDVEGGFVDVNASREPLFGWSERTDRAPTVKLPWDSEEGDAVDSIWSDLGDEPELLDTGRVGREDDRQASEHTVGDGESEDVAGDVGWALEGEEGGMVMLASVVPLAESTDAVEILPEVTGEEASVHREVIRIDKGMGLYQAFELATVPTGQVDESELSSFELKEVGPPADTTASTVPADAPAAEQSAAVNRDSAERPVQSAATIRAIIVAASLTSTIDVRNPGNRSQRRASVQRPRA